MSRLPNVNREAAAFARAAEQQLAQLQKAMRGAEDSLAGLRQAITAPVPKGGRNTIKGSRQTLSPFLRAEASSIGKFISSGITGDDFNFNSFYQSQSQLAAKWSALSLTGQRIS